MVSQRLWFARPSRAHINDPSTGSPTGNFLYILLPPDSQVWASLAMTQCWGSVPPRHRSITAIVQPHHITIIWGGDEDAGRKKVLPMISTPRVEIGEEGRLRVGGDRFARKKRSSSLLVCGSACSSAFFFTAHAFIHAGHYVTPSMMSRPSFG